MAMVTRAASQSVSRRIMTHGSLLPSQRIGSTIRRVPGPPPTLAACFRVHRSPRLRRMTRTASVVAREATLWGLFSLSGVISGGNLVIALLVSSVKSVLLTVTS